MDRRRFIATSALGAAGLMMSGRSASAQGDEYTFAVIADPHLREDREGEATGVEKFRAALARLREEAPGAQFALVLGDIHPQKLEPLLPQIEMPLHPVHGNHEKMEHRQMLREMFSNDFSGRDYYSFERGEDLFVALCTAIPRDHVGHLQSEFISPPAGQLAWLEQTLERRGDWRHVFVYGHIPPEPQLRGDGMCLAQNDARWLVDLVKRTVPTALFFGHRHRRINFTIGQVPVYGVRSTNWNVGGEAVGARVVTVSAEGVRTRFVPTQASG
jgi:hypothetical protein